MLLALHLNMLLAEVGGVAPTITTTTLPNGHVGSSYWQTPSATGDGPFTWDITVGALPDGLLLNSSTGEISGIPTTVESASFTLRASNGYGNDTQALAIQIVAAAASKRRVGNLPAHGLLHLPVRRPVSSIRRGRG